MSFAANLFGRGARVNFCPGIRLWTRNLTKHHIKLSFLRLAGVIKSRKASFGSFSWSWNPGSLIFATFLPCPGDHKPDCRVRAQLFFFFVGMVGVESICLDEQRVFILVRGP